MFREKENNLKANFMIIQRYSTKAVKQLQDPQLLK